LEGSILNESLRMRKSIDENNWKKRIPDKIKRNIGKNAKVKREVATPKKTGENVTLCDIQCVMMSSL
jgi:hypothetical protein